MSIDAEAAASASASASTSEVKPPTWLTLHFTVGSANISLPELPADFDFGFTVPGPPTNAAEAVQNMHSVLRADFPTPTASTSASTAYARIVYRSPSAGWYFSA